MSKKQQLELDDIAFRERVVSHEEANLRNVHHFGLQNEDGNVRPSTKRNVRKYLMCLLLGGFLGEGILTRFKNNQITTQSYNSVTNFMMSSSSTYIKSTENSAEYQQCSRSRGRSFDEIYTIMKSKFKTLTPSDLVNASITTMIFSVTNAKTNFENFIESSNKPEFYETSIKVKICCGSTCSTISRIKYAYTVRTMVLLVKSSEFEGLNKVQAFIKLNKLIGDFLNSLDLENLTGELSNGIVKISSNQVPYLKHMLNVFKDSRNNSAYSSYKSWAVLHKEAIKANAKFQNFKFYSGLELLDFYKP